jgi:anti-sigma B factor antagonist
VVNAEDLGELLCSAFTPGVSLVIADLTSTVFCDSAGLLRLVMAHNYAGGHDAQGCFAIPHRSTLRVLKLTGFDQLLSIYPSLRAAVTAGPVPDGHAASG